MRLAAVAVVLLPSGWVHAQESPSQDKPWRVRLSAGAGYNDNPAAIGDSITFGTPLSAVPFVTDRQSAAGRFTFDGSFDLLADDVQLVTVGYGLHADLYEHDVQEADFLKHNWWIGYSRKLAAQTSLSFQVADEYITIGGDGFTNALLLETTLYHRCTDWLAVEASYHVGFVEQLIPVIGAGFDRDGVFHDLGFTVHLAVPRTDLSLWLGYRRRWTFTEAGNGGRFDLNSDRVTLGAAHPLPLDCTLTVSWARQWDDYDGILVGPATVREDQVDFYSINLTHRLSTQVSLYFQFDYVEAESNGVLFDHRQRVYGAGVIFEF